MRSTAFVTDDVPERNSYLPKYLHNTSERQAYARTMELEAMHSTTEVPFDAYSDANGPS